MADHEGGAVQAAPGKAGRGKLISWMVVAVLMAFEGAAVFVAARFLMPGPAGVKAADGQEESPAASRPGTREPELAEVELAECRPMNQETGKLVTFHLRVSALVRAADAQRVQELVESNQARIKDRINIVVRGLEPKYFAEPGMQTLKRRLKREIDPIFGDDRLIREILIPEMLQSGSGL